MDICKKTIGGKSYDLTNPKEYFFEEWVASSIEPWYIKGISPKKLYGEYKLYFSFHKKCSVCGIIFKVGTEGCLLNKKPFCNSDTCQSEMISFKEKLRNNAVLRYEEKVKNCEIFKYRNKEFDIKDSNFFENLRKAKLSGTDESFLKFPWYKEYQNYFKNTFVCSICGGVYPIERNKRISKSNFVIPQNV